jgi:hypothetical protein
VGNPGGRPLFSLRMYFKCDLIGTGKDALMQKPGDFQAFIIEMAFQYAQTTWYWI